VKSHTKSADTTVSFTVTATKEKIDSFEKGKDGLLGKFKLSTTISTKNMTLFNDQGKIQRYQTSVDILRAFFDHRLEFYVKRKGMLLEKMGRELSILENKARFVEEVCNEDLVVSNRKRKELLHELKERGYDLFPKDEKKREEDDDDDDESSVEESASDADLAKGYEYLLGMKIWSLTHERAEELRRQRAEKAQEVDELNATSPEQLWSNDLDAIEEALTERDADIAADLKHEVNAQSKNSARNKKKAVSKAKAAKKSKKKVDEWDSDLEESDDDSGDDFAVTKPGKDNARCQVNKCIPFSGPHIPCPLPNNRRSAQEKGGPEEGSCSEEDRTEEEDAVCCCCSSCIIGNSLNLRARCTGRTSARQGKAGPRKDFSPCQEGRTQESGPGQEGRTQESPAEKTYEEGL